MNISQCDKVTSTSAASVPKPCGTCRRKPNIFHKFNVIQKKIDEMCQSRACSPNTAPVDLEPLPASVSDEFRADLRKIRQKLELGLVFFCFAGLYVLTLGLTISSLGFAFIYLPRSPSATGVDGSVRSGVKKTPGKKNI